MALISTVWYSLLALLGLSIRPDSLATEGAGGISCGGLKVKNGFANCNNHGYQTVCEVFCDGQHQGAFICTEDKGWRPALPTCAKPIEGPDRITPSGGGCPDDAKCNIACQEDPRFHSKGSCVGPDKASCACEIPYVATEQPVDAEATGCNKRECENLCYRRFYRLLGFCALGGCRCLLM